MAIPNSIKVNIPSVLKPQPSKCSICNKKSGIGSTVCESCKKYSEICKSCYTEYSTKVHEGCPKCKYTCAKCKETHHEAAFSIWDYKDDFLKICSKCDQKFKCKKCNTWVYDELKLDVYCTCNGIPREVVFNKGCLLCGLRISRAIALPVGTERYREGVPLTANYCEGCTERAGMTKIGVIPSNKVE